MKQKWIGLFDVKPQEGQEEVLDGAIGAYVNVIAIAASKCEFEDISEKAFNEFGLNVLSIQDVSKVEDKYQELTEELIEGVDTTDDLNPIFFDEFQAYESD